MIESTASALRSYRFINRFTHWFCRNYKRFGGREDQLPVDQHMLIALMAPRLVYVASAVDDAWADPEGEFSSCIHAGPAYALYQLDGLNSTKMPELEAPLHDGRIGYHLRRGGHGLTEYDWNRFMDFTDKHWK